MNVLVDRHHAGLYRSLQLLAARLGWNLYTPVGLDWMTERYWMFGMNQGTTADLANQYLVPHEGIWTALDDDGWYVTGDPEFPGVPIQGVTLDRARQMPWGYVVATLDDDQWGFSRFAAEVGARYVVQVGNTGQHVAWQLDPLAIVSSEVPIAGRGVRYHQEMDPAAVVFRDPADAVQGMVSSFVNCFPRIGPCYELWQVMQTALPAYVFNEFGIDGAQGVVKPIGDLAERMGRSAFGWHDKVHGDGFGHVIHGWAAVGRPIIGHGHHYRGKMAEHLWQHGRTAIDLDLLTIAEAAQMIRDIAADPDRHAEMCHAIRAEFDRIDFNGEAQAIADLLGVAVAA
jgi:hypothetical protein